MAIRVQRREKGSIVTDWVSKRRACELLGMTDGAIRSKIARKWQHWVGTSLSVRNESFSELVERHREALNSYKTFEVRFPPRKMIPDDIGMRFPCDTPAVMKWEDLA